MTITANSGPNVAFGITMGSTGATAQYNEERGPSVFDLGHATMDSRYQFGYTPGSPVGTPLLCLFNGIGVIDAVPSAANSSLNYVPGTIASCLTGSSQATTLTLNTSTITGITYTPSVRAANGTTIRPAIAIDSTSQYLTFGSGGTICAWNPANAIARCIAITGSSSGVNDGSVTALVAGWDIYGMPMSETITLGTSSLNGAIGRKAFKYVQSITLANSSLLNSSHINIAFSDRIGFPTRVDTPLYAVLTTVTSNSSSQTTYGTSQGVVFASTATATATTSDVRGTWTSTAASVNFDGNIRVQARFTLPVANVNTVSGSDMSGIFGVTQYST